MLVGLGMVEVDVHKIYALAGNIEKVIVMYGIVSHNSLTIHMTFSIVFIVDYLKMKGGLIIAETTNLNIRIDKELKEQAEVFFNELGLTFSHYRLAFYKTLHNVKCG